MDESTSNADALLRPSLTDPRLGQVLSARYRIDKKLGEGGMGVVYAGTHLLIKRRVAIKMLHPQFAQDGAVVARFQREAQSATAIGHPHIVEVFDMGNTPDGAVYMVLEFLDGQDFAHLLESTNGLLPLGRVARILAQVADALSAAHEAKIVHRDLKPENVFLVKRGEEADFVKLVDFGISKMLDDAEGQVNKGLTRTGTAMGTPYYMPPEQIEGRKTIDHRADLYALGVMAYRALAGVFPFDAETLPMLMMRVLTSAPVSIASYRPDLPADVIALVDGLLAKDPAARPQSAKEVRAIFLLHEGNAREPVLARVSIPQGVVSPASFAETAVAEASPSGVNVSVAAASQPELHATIVPQSTSRRSVGMAVVVALAMLVIAALWMRERANTEESVLATRNPEVAHPSAPTEAHLPESAPTLEARISGDVPPETVIDAPAAQVRTRTRLRAPRETSSGAASPIETVPEAEAVPPAPSLPAAEPTTTTPAGASAAVKNPFARPRATP